MLCWTQAMRLLLILALTAMYTSTANADQQPSGRNILFIAVDDLRNWLNYTGEYPGPIYTPNIDDLAAQSTRYRNAYVPVPKCEGSRTSIMLGISPPNHGYGFGDHIYYYSRPVYDAVYRNPAITSLPEALSSHYYTATAGKIFAFPHKETDRWHENGPIPWMPDYYNILQPGPDGTYFYAQELMEGDENPDQDIADWAVEFIETYDRSEPFFLAVGFNLPHQPWRVPSWAYSMYHGAPAPVPHEGDLEDVPDKGVELALTKALYADITEHDLVQERGKADYYTQAYLAGITHTDTMVGLLLDALLSSPYASSTDIVFWSDHGYHLGEKFHWRKSTLWEQSTKVPLLIRAPSYPPRDVSEAVNLLDLAATVMDLAGLTPPEQFEGAPLNDAQNRSPAETYWHNGKATVQDGVKIIDYDLEVNTISDREKYNLVEDPEELTNLIRTGC